MNLKPIKQNMTELEFPNSYVLVSYSTPVACTMKSTGEVFVTNKFWSKTTSRHINQWLKSFAINETNLDVIEKPQKFFDELVQ